MKQFPDGNNNFPLVEKSSSSTGSPPTAENFNGVTAELVNIIKKAGFPLDSLSGESSGSDNKPLMESESNKQIIRAIENLDQQTYLKSAEDNNKIIQNILGTGIVKGLTVTKTDTLKVSIAEGLGYDPLGRQIILDAPLEIDLSEFGQDAASCSVRIGLKYEIIPPNYITGEESPNYKDTILITAIGVIDYPPLPENILWLGTCEASNSGVYNIDNYDPIESFPDIKKYISDTNDDIKKYISDTNDDIKKNISMFSGMIGYQKITRAGSGRYTPGPNVRAIFVELQGGGGAGTFCETYYSGWTYDGSDGGSTIFKNLTALGGAGAYYNRDEFHHVGTNPGQGRFSINGYPTSLNLYTPPKFGGAGINAEYEYGGSLFPDDINTIKGTPHSPGLSIFNKNNSSMIFIEENTKTALNPDVSGFYILTDSERRSGISYTVGAGGININDPDNDPIQCRGAGGLIVIHEFGVPDWSQDNSRDLNSDDSLEDSAEFTNSIIEHLEDPPEVYPSDNNNLRTFQAQEKTIYQAVHETEHEIRQLKDQYLDADIDDNEELKLSLKQQVKDKRGELQVLKNQILESEDLNTEK